MMANAQARFEDSVRAGKTEEEAFAEVLSTLDALERKSVIGRFPHEKDRRRKVIRFTTEGRDLAEKLVNDLHEWEIKALSSISKTELTRAFKTVKLFCTELEKGLKE